MSLDRRDLLRLLGLAAGGASLGCGSREARLPDHLVELALRGPGVESTANTACGLCQGGCGMTVRLVDGLPVGLRGNPNHPVNRGGLCPVGHAALDLLYAPDRLTGPLARRPGGGHEPASWDLALGTIAERLAAVGGDRVAFLSDEPGALFHDLLDRFAATLSSANVARASSALTLPYLLSQGRDAPPAVDLHGTDLVVSFGLDLFEDGPTPVHASSALIGARDGGRATLLHIGSRISPTAAKADLHVAVRPGGHAAFALGVAHVLVREERYDRTFVAAHTDGFEDWTDERGTARLGFRRLLLERYYPDRAARLCGCRAGEILETARRLAAAARPVAVVGGEALATGNALWAALAVNALNALLGAFGRRGGVLLPPPVPFTPLEPVSHPRGESIFSPAPPALAADPVTTLARRVLDGDREISVLFIVESNPVFASPSGELLRQAMARIPLVVALTPFRDDTAALADLVLPTPLFLESWRETTTPTGVPFGLLNLSHPVVEPLHDTRHPGDVLLDLAHRAGQAAAAILPWQSYVDYLKHRLEGLVLSGQGSVVSGSFEEAWVRYLEERGWRFLEHADVEQFWGDLAREGAWWNPVHGHGDWSRLFPATDGRFSFHSRRLEGWLRDLGGPGGVGAGARRLGLSAAADEACLPHFEPPSLDGDGDLLLVPFRTTTGRGRFGVASAMVQEMFGYSVLSGWETWVELAPETAERHGVEHGDLVELSSAAGAFAAVVVVIPGTVSDVAAVPVGLGHAELGATAEGRGADPLAAIVARVDELSGRPASAATRVRLRRLSRRRHGGSRPAWMGEA